ncbi:phage adaptor protein [Ensifer adhaerens]
MTLLSAINEVCDVVSLDRFTSVYGSTNPNAQTMLALAQEAGDEIARRGDWQKMLKTETAVSSPLTIPSDYERMTPGGAVRTSAGDFVRPITNSSQWAVILAVPSSQPYFFIKGGQVLFSPTAAGTGAIVDYVSSNWIMKNVGGEAAAWSADDDTTLFPERLLVKGVLWRWKRQKGLSYDDNLAEFEADLVQELNADRGA